MKFVFKISIVLLVILFAACGPSDEDKARGRMNLVRSLLENNDTIAALKHLDSIPDLYPKAVYSVNAANNLKSEIQFDLLHRKEAQLDSLEVLISELERPFKKEKTQFDRYTQYIHKRQDFERSWDRSYIKIHLDERGEIYLSSNYHGEEWLNHTGIRVYDRGDDAKTEKIPLDDVNNHRSDFMDSKWEKVTYRNGKDNGVIEFIANNTDRRLKAVFLGDRYYYIILETYDKQAVKDALDLSKAIKKKSILVDEIGRLKTQLQVK
jgi:hypothetical protein